MKHVAEVNLGCCIADRVAEWQSKWMYELKVDAKLQFHKSKLKTKQFQEFQLSLSCLESH